MNRSFSIWWLLPVITAFLGTGLSILMHQPINITQTSLSNKVSEPHKLTIKNVALPPAPIVYQPTLTAKIHNNKVVVSKDEAFEEPTATVKEPIKVSNTNKVASNATLNTSQSDLAKQLSQVMQEMAEEDNQPESEDKLHAQALTLYPQWYQDLVPPLEFTTHIYSNDKNERWVRVNEQVVKEGELITSQMRLVAIEPQQVIIEMQKRRFTLPALTSW